MDVPPKELELLYFLASNYNIVFTRDQLLDKVWGFDYLGDSRTVDVHVKRLREKLEGVPTNGRSRRSGASAINSNCWDNASSGDVARGAASPGVRKEEVWASKAYLPSTYLLLC